MIILDLLRITDWNKISTEVEFAKGMLEIPKTRKQKKQQNKRFKQWQ
jgi:hypothetical protein